MRDKLIIRDGKLEDLEEIIKIEEASFKDPWNIRGFEEQIKSDNAYLLVAEADGKIVFYLCYYLVLDMVYISKVAVLKDFRNMSVAKYILGKLIFGKWSEYIKEIVLEVRKSNLAGRKLYLSLGFKEAGERKNYYSDGESGIMMVLKMSDKGE